MRVRFPTHGATRARASSRAVAFKAQITQSTAPISALGLSLGQLRKHRPDAVQAAMRELLAWYAEGRLHPHVSNTFPLADYAEAMRLLRDRRSTGKVVLRVSEDAG